MSEVCPSCRGAWREETGVRCPGCGHAYHYPCWRANGGCLFFVCRGSFDEIEPALVDGLGEGNCKICARPAADATSHRCVGCGRLYHDACWSPNEGCVRHACRSASGALLRVGAPLRLQGAGELALGRDAQERAALLAATLLVAVLVAARALLGAG